MGEHVSVAAVRHGMTMRRGDSDEFHLSREGEHQAEMAARKLLVACSGRPLVVYCSPAPRAREMAEFMCRSLGVEPTAVNWLGIRTADELVVTALREVTDMADDHTVLVLVGHEPQVRLLAKAPYPVPCDPGNVFLGEQRL